MFNKRKYRMGKGKDTLFGFVIAEKSFQVVRIGAL